MIDTDKYEGHTPADQWTIYKMGADKPYHAVRFGQRGLDLELEFGADAELIADAPLLLKAYKRLRKELSEAEDVIQYALDMTSDDDAKNVFEDFLGGERRMIDTDKCTHCGKAIEVPEGEVWSDGCWECYFEQYPDER